MTLALPTPSPGPPTGATPVTVLQSTGGSTTLVLLAFATLFVATLLSLYVAVRLFRGYRTSGSPAMLRLFAGLVLLTTVPILLRLTLSNVGGVPATTRALAATTSQLLGLLVILGVVYERD